MIADLLTRWEFYLSILVIFIISKLIIWLTDPLRNIPGPRGYPIIGNTLDYSFGKDLKNIYLERERKYGKVYKDYSVFAGTTVHVSDPEFAKRILVTNSSNYDRQKLIVKQLPALGTGLHTTNGKEHAIMRKHLNPMFTLGSVKEFISVFNDKANQLVQFIEARIIENNKTSIEMQITQKFIDLTLDVIGLYTFGYNFNTVMGGMSEEARATNTILTVNFNIVRKSFEELFPLLKLIPSKERDDLKRAEDIFYGLIKKAIATRISEMETHPGETMEKHDLLQKLISMYKEAGLGISNKDLFHQIFTFMLAGHETSSIGLTWVIFQLAKYHNHQRRLQEEIKDALDGGSKITFETIDKLRFLDNFIKETMRLYPVGLAVGRQARSTDRFGPYTIPAGTRLLVNIAALSNNPEHWKNPNDFDPDRFDVKGEHDPMFPYYYMPFSRGPRMCIGYRFAQMEMKVVLAHLLKNFSFKLAKSQSPDIGGLSILTYRPYPAPLIEISRI